MSHKNLSAKIKIPRILKDKLNNKKIQGFVDKSGNFIAKKNADKKNLNKLKNVNCENIALSSLIIDKAYQAQKVLK